jgi:signal transduction histidine kinase
VVPQKPPVERTNTDQSLRDERSKTDVELSKIGARVEREADAVVVEARNDADATQRAARADTDAELQGAGASPKVIAAAIAEQRLADDTLAAERKATDEELAAEREQRHRAVAALLEAERVQTDAHLLLERAQSDTTLGQLFAELAEAVRLRDELLCVASHELRTPLTPMALSLHQLVNEAAATPESPLAQSVNRYVTVAQRQLDKLTRLIADLIEVENPSTRAPAAKLASVELGRIVRDVATRYQVHAQTARCSLTVDATDGVNGQWDALRIDHVVANLLENALKFGAGKPVRIRLRATPTVARLSIADEGIGVAVEDRPRIFDRFARAVSHRNYGGLGLGLYIARSNVEALGGTITVDGEPGCGATFTVELPITTSA